MKTDKKLTQKDYDRMWGECGPYSQVRLCEETRILDDSVSRVFLVVEAEINPFTFEYVRKHRQQFAQDEAVLQLLDHAEYRGEFGYVVSAGEAELRDEESIKFARKQADMTIQLLIRIHSFVMEKCGLNKKDNEFGIIKDDSIIDGKRFVWNKWVGRTEPVEGELWEDKTSVGSPAGIRNNKARLFVVLAFVKNPDLRKEKAIKFADVLKDVSIRFGVEIEEVESFSEYVLITALLPFDVAPADFIEKTLAECDTAMEKQFFQKDYFITNVKRPSPEEIVSFLKQIR